MNSTKARLGLSLLLGLCAPSPARADDAVRWLESDGALVIEAESATLAEGWVLDTETPGFSGTGYLRWNGENHFRRQDAGVGTLSFRFTVESAGNYQLFLRSRITVGESTTEHNDSWARLVGGSDVPDEHPLSGWTKVYMNALDSWSWATKTVDEVGLPLRQHFDAGTHVLEISGRSRGHAIDRVVLLRYEERSYGAGALDALPVSDSTTSGESGDGDTDGDGGGTTNGGDDGNGGETTGGDDAGGEIVQPYNAEEIATDEENGERIAGECSDDVLELEPLADVHETGIGYADAAALSVAGDGHRALLRFDLTGVPPFVDAALRYTVAAENVPGEGALGDDAAANARAGSGELAVRLGSHADWRADDEPGSAPHTLVELGTALAGWRVGVRHESTLTASLIQNAAITLLLETIPGDTLSVVSSEDPARGPRLRLRGETGFCDAHALMNTPPPVIEPAPEIVPGVTVEETEADDRKEEEVAEENAAVADADADGGSGSGSFWLAVPIALLARHRRRIAVREAESVEARAGR